MTRIAWIDNLKILAIILVVILHTAVTYSGIGGWYYIENEKVDMFSTLFFAFYLTFTQAYFMSLFFMVSGYFSQASIQKKGTKRFLISRLKRLGIPLLIYIFLIHPIAVKLAYPETDLLDWYRNGIVNLHFFSWTGPLWFVEALLIFSLLYILISKLFPKLRTKYSIKLGYANVAMMIMLIAALAFVIRLYYKIGTDFYNLQFSFFSAYIFMFAMGIIAYSSDLFSKISYADGKKWLAISLGIGIPAWFVLMFLGGAVDGSMLIEGGMNWPAAFYAIWESFICVTFIIALLGIFKYKVNTGGRLQKFLSDNAFGVFVFHAPVLIFISVSLKDVALYPVLSFFVVFPLAVIASFFVSWLVRRVGVLRRIFS